MNGADVRFATVVQSAELEEISIRIESTVPVPEVEKVSVWVPLMTSFSLGPLEKLADSDEDILTTSSCSKESRLTESKGTNAIIKSKTRRKDLQRSCLPMKLRHHRLPLKPPIFIDTNWLVFRCRRIAKSNESRNKSEFG